MERIGIVFGCFIPLHKGHKHLIEESIKDNDKTIICVCGYENDRGEDFIPFPDRYDLMCRKYENEDVYVICVDDHKIGLTGLFDTQSWGIWGDEFFSQFYDKYGLPIDFDKAEVTWYTGELDYVDKLSSIYTEDNFKYFGRNNINISGTQIRNNYSSCKHYVDDDFKEYLSRHGIR